MASTPLSKDTNWQTRLKTKTPQSVFTRNLSYRQKQTLPCDERVGEDLPS
jgi:hypothetical protein